MSAATAGLLAASPATIVAPNGQIQPIDLMLLNTGSSEETVALTISNDGATTRAIQGCVLLEDEGAVYARIWIGPNDTLTASSTNANVVTWRAQPSAALGFSLTTFAADGSIKTSNTSTSTGNEHVTGNLTVDGTSTLTGDVTMAGAATVGGAVVLLSALNLKKTVVPAAGSTQGDAALLITGFNSVTGGNGPVGVRTPAAGATGSAPVVIANESGGILKVYPPTSGTINNSSGAFTMAARAGGMLMPSGTITYTTIGGSIINA